MATDQTQDRRELLKNAFGAIEQLKARVRSLESASTEPIAIVGAGCRFPGGANGLEAYWSLLDDGRDVVSEIPASRWEMVGYPGTESGLHAGLVDEIDGFDPRFFGISAREATTMDPQQRMVLEVAWAALEHAGYAPDRLNGSRTGVFLGITGHDYADLLHDAGALVDVYAATGNASNAAAGRLSFLLGLNGPSMAIDTACSSSLSAIHTACLALRAGDCRLALAGGVNAILSPGPFVCFRNWGMMAPDGRCKTFDARADGFVRGEGCGMIVLKRLSDAKADGDRILAVIRGSAVNQDGRSSGLTVPNGPAQEAVIRQALAAARLHPADVGYVEAHGTGTALGDPIEAHALAAVLGDGRSTDNPLVIGSVKTNIGHLESAAGIAGLLKVVLSFQHGRIPAHLHFTQPSPNIDWGGVPVEIPVEAREWTRGARPRIAGVSSFGFSGTNAHVILEEPPLVERPRIEHERGLHVFTFSARTESARDVLASRHAAHLSRTADDIGDICYTASTGRAHFSERVAVVAETREELRESLLAHRWMEGRAPAAGTRVAFLFTGQGSQWVGMGRELYEREPVFRAALDECAALLGAHLERPLLDVIFGTTAASAALLDETQYTQPALAALEYALAQLWQSWGITPAAVLGHSVGEYAALIVAGVWSLADGLRVIAERGRLMQELGPGWGMTAVQCDRARAVAAITGFTSVISVAAVNGADNVVLSGRLAELAAVEQRLEAGGVRVKRLNVSHAFHSPQMDDMAAEFARVVATAPMQAPAVPVISSVTGEPVTLSGLRDASYWRRQVRNAVEFNSALETLVAAGHSTFLEIGPTATLCAIGSQSVSCDGQSWTPSLRRDQSAVQQMLESLARLHVRGADVDWARFDAANERRRVALPVYPFERKRVWASESSRPMGTRAGPHPFLGERFDIAGPVETCAWQTDISLGAFPYFADHRVQGGAVVPATAYLEMAVAAGREVLGDGPVSITGAAFHKPLFLAEHTVAHLQVSFDVRAGTVRVHSRASTSGAWTLHASFTVARAEQPQHPAPPADYALRARREMTAAEFYSYFAARGNEWGPLFQGVEHAWLTDEEGWASVVVPEPVRADTPKYHVHPAVADALGHVLAAIAAPSSGAFVGEGIEQVRVYGRPRGHRLFAHARLTPIDDPTRRRGDVRVFDEDGQLVSELVGAQLRYIDVAPSAAASQRVGDWFHRVAWREIPFGDAAPPAGEWIVLAEDGAGESLAADLAQRMQRDGAGVTIVRDGSIAAARARLSGSRPKGIVDLRALGARRPDAEHSSFSKAATTLVELVRALADGPQVRLWVVTRGVQPVDAAPSEQAIWQAPLWGIGRTAAIEYPELFGGLVDLDPSADCASNADSLWRHISAPDGEDQVALRGERRFGARLERCDVPESASPALRTDGTYLVTGGLGGLGLEAARWLAASGARRLILLGRTALPPRTQWSTIASDHPRAAAVRTIRELESAGVSVHTGAVDVSDARELGRYLDAYASEGWPPIRGVLHAAGVLRHELLASLTAGGLEELLRPKMGAWVLSRALGASPLDFFVLFSSASALLSSPKLGAYAAANCFLDAFAHYRSGAGQPTLSVDWGVWGDAGMASRFGTDSVRNLADRGMGAMRTEQGFEALARLMGHADSQVAVLPVDWRRWAELFPTYTSAPLLADLLQAHASAPSDARRGARSAELLDADPAVRDERVTRYLAQTIGGILGFAASDVDPSVSISVLGLDSLTAAELRNRIGSELGVTVPTVRFLQGPTITELATEISPLLQASASGPTRRDEAELLRQLDELSEAELDAALSEFLQRDSAT